MPQWSEHVRPRLSSLRLSPAREHEIVEELSQHLEDRWRELVAGGASWDEATRLALAEFLRGYSKPGGRVAFYSAARNIALDDPLGSEGLWTRLSTLSPKALFIWGKRDPLVPIGFERHVQERLPAATHLELPCGHLPQVERPHELIAGIRTFLQVD